MGATKRQISFMVYFEGFILSTLGITLGILLGYALASGISYILTVRFNALAMRDFMFRPIVNIFVIGMIYLAGYLSVFLPIRKSVKRASNISAIETIRQSNTFKGKEVTAPSFFSFEGQLAYKNIKRDKTKHRGTTISLVVTMVVLISVSSLISTLRKQIDINTPDNSYDVILRSFDDSGNVIEVLDEVDSKLYDRVRSFSSIVKTVENTDFLDEHLNVYKDAGYNIFVLAEYIFMEDADYEAWIRELGIDTSAKGEIVVNRAKGTLMGTSSAIEVSLDDVNLKKGDFLSVSEMDEVDLKNEIKIVGLVDELPWGVVSSIRNLSINIVIPMSRIHEHINSNSNISQTLTFKSNEHKALASALEDSLENNGFYSSYVENQKQNRLLLNAVIESGTLIMYLVAGFIILICISNVINVVISGIRVRQGENAILRSVGMLSSDIRKMLIYESLLTSLKPLIMGSVLGIAGAYGVYLTMNSQIPLSGFEVDVLSIVVSWLMVLLVLVVNMMYSLTYASREDIIEDLRSDAL